MHRQLSARSREHYVQWATSRRSPRSPRRERATVQPHHTAGATASSGQACDTGPRRDEPWRRRVG